MSAAAIKRLCRARDEGTLARRQITQFIIRSEETGVHTNPPSSHLVLLSFIASLDPFEQVAWLPLLQSTSVAVRGKEALGGRYRHYPCFGFVEMADQIAKAKSFYKTFYTVVTNSGG